MSIYSGEKCTACGKDFTDDDDIVVCPECGTPYHRSCWKETGRCVNDELHKTHKSWISEHRAKQTDDSSVKSICPKCRTVNNEDSTKCSRCGYDLSSGQCSKIDMNDPGFIKVDFNDEYFGMDPDEKLDETDSLTLGEFGDYVRSNKFYYLAVFRRIKNTGVKLSFNIFAFLFPNYYCASRKMYLWSGILTVLSVILLMPQYFEYFSGYGGVTGKFIESLNISGFVTELMYSFSVIIRILFGVFANSIYFAHIRKKLITTRKSSSSESEYRYRIKSAGGASIISVIIIMLIEITLVLFTYAAVSAVAYFNAFG